MRIYVASRSEDYEEVRRWQAKLKAAGHIIAHDWTPDVEKFLAGVPFGKSERVASANKDLEGIRSADVIWVLAPEKGGTGVWVEMGYALASSTHTVISGPSRSVFDEVVQYRAETHEEAFDYLTRMHLMIAEQKERVTTILRALGPNAYQALAMRTMNSPLDRIKRKAMCALGVAGEAGEVADYMKKVLFHGIPMDREKLVKELGDVCWYIATLAHECSIPLAEVLEKNIEKLKKRYPAGFSTEASIARADGEINDQDAEYKS